MNIKFLLQIYVQRTLYYHPYYIVITYNVLNTAIL